MEDENHERKWTTKTLLIYLKCILFYLWKTYFPSEKMV